MHNIGFFADIRYDNILQLIWPIIDTDADIYVNFSPHLFAEIIKSLLEWNLHAVLLFKLLLCWPVSKCRHKTQSLKIMY